MINYLILLSPALSNYVLYNMISVGDALIIFSMFIFIIKYKLDLKQVIIIFAINIPFIIISYLNIYPDIQPGFYRLSFFISALLLILSISEESINVNAKKFIKSYEFLSLFFSISIIIQFLIYFVFDITLVLQLPLPVFELDTLHVITHVFRSGGWFKEPSYFILFISPLLYYYIIMLDIKKASIILFAGVISTSSLILFVFLLSILIKNKKIFFSLFLIGGFLLIFQDFLSNFIFFERIFEIFENGGTLNGRFFSGFNLPQSPYILFSNNDVYDFFIVSNNNDNVWYSSFFYLLASFGWWSIIIFLLFALRLRAAFFFLLAFLMTTHIFSTPYVITITYAFLVFNTYIKHNKSDGIYVYK